MVEGSISWPEINWTCVRRIAVSLQIVRTSRNPLVYFYRIWVPYITPFPHFFFSLSLFETIISFHLSGWTPPHPPTFPSSHTFFSPSQFFSFPILFLRLVGVFPLSNAMIRWNKYDYLKLTDKLWRSLPPFPPSMGPISWFTNALSPFHLLLRDLFLFPEIFFHFPNGEG